MDKIQITAIIGALSQRFESVEKTVSQRLDNAFEKCRKGKSRLIKGDLSGIQDFIYNVNRAEDVDGGAAKRLRGRSFYVSAACLAFSTELLNELGEPMCCRLSWSGGKFLLMVPESKKLDEKVWEWKKEVDDWLWAELWGDVFLNLAVSEPRPVNELNDQYIQISQDLQNRLERGKLKKFEETLREEMPCDKSKHNTSYRERVFDTGYEQECHSCGRLPRMGNRAKGKAGWEPNLCYICNKLENVAGYKGLPSRPYVVCSKQQGAENQSVQIHKTWAILANSGDELVPAYLPQLYKPGEEDLKKRELCDRACTLIESQRGKGRANCNDERLPTRFHCLAALVNDKAKAKGNKKIAVMAGDMDHLSVMMNSIPDMTLKQAVKLGEFIYHFFAVEMIELLKKYEMYLVYSGGDDFVVVGAWERVFKFADELSRRWEGLMPEGTTQSERLTFSAGVQITNPQYPIYEGIDQARGLLKNAKDEGRNRIDVMGVVMEWETYREALEKAKWFKDQVRDGDNQEGPITIGFLYRMYDILEQYNKWHTDRDPIGLQYASQLATHTQRNIKDNPMGNEVKSCLQPLLKVGDETLLPHFRFILDWVVLMKRD